MPTRAIRIAKIIEYTKYWRAEEVMLLGSPGFEKAAKMYVLAPQKSSPVAMINREIEIFL